MPTRVFHLLGDGYLQIPNFLLAAPVLVLSLAGIWTYIRSRPLHVATGGLFGLGTEGETLGAGGTGFLSPAVAVFIYPWAFMVGCAILVMHVQVGLGVRVTGGSLPEGQLLLP